MMFLAPLFLLGALAIGLPIVFHLVRRSSRENIVFSSLMFLKPTPPRMTRRNRIENIFLLLLRCLAIAILSLGFARPFLQKPMAVSSSNTGGSTLIVLVDTSASMRRNGLWPDALSRASAAIRNVSSADRVALFTFDDQVRTVVGFEEWAGMAVNDRASLASQRLNGIGPSWRTTHLGNALIAAAEALEDAERRDKLPGEKHVLLVTDLQEGSRLDGLQGYEWPQGVKVTVETVGNRRPTNAGLQWIADSGESTAADDTIRVRVSNASNSEREQFELRWDNIDGTTTIDAYIPPGQSRILAAPQLPDGKVPQRISLMGDDDDFDNSVFVVRPAIEQIDVLFAGNDSGNDPSQLLYYLKRAFQQTRQRAVRVSTGVESIDSAESARLMIVPGELGEERMGAIAGVLENGGTVLFVMTDDRSGQVLAKVAGAPQFSASEAPVASYAMLGWIDFEHPLFVSFADPRFSDFRNIRFWKYRKLDVDRLPDARILARFDNDDPALIEIPKGKGRLLVLASSWRPADSQLALSSKFVPLLYSMLEQAGAIASRPAQYRVGETVDIPTSIKPLSAGSIRKPDGSEIAISSGQTRFTETDTPGIYAFGTTAPFSFAVNLDPSESRTAPLPLDELERIGVPLKPGETDVAMQAERMRKLHNVDLENEQKLWRWLIVAALVVLVFETWVAGWITRRASWNRGGAEQ